MRPYTSGSSTPWKCSTLNCKDDAKFKTENGMNFYCEPCAKRVLKVDEDEAATALLRWIDSERHHFSR
jgi:hypothetical protein